MKKPLHSTRPIPANACMVELGSFHVLRKKNGKYDIVRTSDDPRDPLHGKQIHIATAANLELARLIANSVAGAGAFRFYNLPGAVPLITERDEYQGEQETL